MSDLGNNIEEYDDEGFRDNISTVDASGKRVWIYPKKPKGRFYDYRKLLSYVLLIILFGLPFIQYKGKPFVLFNIADLEFIIFGIYFGPQDFYLYVIAMLIGIIFIALFTVIYGRLFCGWICPQTIFMEMVYRRIEYWIEGDYNQQKKLDKAPWSTDKIIKKTIKHIAFLMIAAIIAHTFLAYFIGIDEVWNIITAPIGEHVTGLIMMIIFTIVFYSVFARLREQVCTTICPYGRLQGVLLDNDSLAVNYDFVRGEPRGRLKKKKRKPVKPACGDGCNTCSSPPLASQTSPTHVTTPADPFKIQMDNPATEIPEKGDCIDCDLCVKVCPTGIDIRNGIQLECVNCTACMDACDEVMEKIDRPKGLIRIDSYNAIIDKKKSIWTPRVLAYSMVLVALLGLESFLFLSRSQVDTLLLRTPGMLYQKTDDGHISNLYNYQLINKTDLEVEISFSVEGKDYIIFEPVGKAPTTKKKQVTEGALFIKIPRDKLESRSTKLKVQVYGDGELIDEAKTSFLGPVK